MHLQKKYSSDECPFHWLDLEAEEDSIIIECNGNRYKAKEAKAKLCGDRLIITGCCGVRGDLSAEIKIENAEQNDRIAKAVAENAHLKDALEPIISLNLDGLSEYDDIDFSNLLSDVISDSQQRYNANTKGE